MIYSYGVSMAGPYHVDNNIPNQDAYKATPDSEKMVIAAVADGLGSAKYSDVASKLAVEVSLEHCKSHVGKAKNEIDLLTIIRDSFKEALSAIDEKAKEESHERKEYDTTLSLVIYCNEDVFYGHSGDSGIVALTTEGLYKKVTEQQRDENNCVFPLDFQDKWVIRRFSEKVSSVFLATDGMLETLFPLYIRKEPVNIHVALAQFFMDNQKLNIHEEGTNTVQSRVTDFIGNIPKEQVDDDKTILVLIDTSSKPRTQSDEYYSEPDWAALKKKHDEEWKRLAYPHLFGDDAQNTDSDESESSNESSTIISDTEESEERKTSGEPITTQNKKSRISNFFKK